MTVFAEQYDFAITCDNHIRAMLDPVEHL